MSMLHSHIIYGDQVHYQKAKADNNALRKSLIKSSRPYYFVENLQNGDVNVLSSKTDGLFLSAFVKQTVIDKYNVNTNFTYIELTNDFIYWLTVGQLGEIVTDVYIELDMVSGKAQLAELEMHLRDFENTAHTIIEASSSSETDHNCFLSPSELCIKGHRKRFIQIDKQNDQTFNVVSSTTLIVHFLMVSEGENLYLPSCIAKNAIKSNSPRTSILIVSAVASVFIVLIGLLTFRNYLLEQERLDSLSKIKEVVYIPPYQAYKDRVTDGDKVTRAESALTQIGYIIATFDKANTNAILNGTQALNWSIDKLKAEGRGVIVTPKSIGGRRTDLTNFAKKYQFSIFTDSKGMNLAIGLVSAPLMTPDNVFYHRSLDAEFDYINDAIEFLEDDIKVTMSNRVTNGSDDSLYTMGLIKVDFKCWLAQDFVYVATQFAGRNYSFHSIDAASSGSDSINSQCGLSGNFNLEVYSKF